MRIKDTLIILKSKFHKNDGVVHSVKARLSNFQDDYAKNLLNLLTKVYFENNLPETINLNPN